MGNHTISPPDKVYETVKDAIKKERDSVKPRFDYSSVTDFITQKMRDFIDKYKLGK